jgi:2-polyprenyl-3-methyl-5-hydroxy-6-metoxy-1,4-benzoquinol methylase
METDKTNTLTLLLLEGADAYNRWIFERIQPFLKGKILEVGCGIGNLTGLLLHQGEVMTTDVKADYLNIVREKYRGHPNLTGTLIWDIRSVPPDGLRYPFDVIVCSNVLEHIEDDMTVLKHFHRLLSETGRLILLVPALTWLFNQLDKDLGHFRRYSKKNLVMKIEQSHFRILDLTYFNLFGMLGWFFNGSILRRRMLPTNQVKLFNRLVPLFRSLEKITSNWIGQSLIVVGEKQ